MHKVCALFLLIAVASSSCVRKGYRRAFLKVENGVDRHYQGKYKNHETYKQLTQSMPLMRKQALDHIKQKAGLKRCDSDVVISFRDGDTLHAETSTRQLDGEIVEVIFLYLEKIISGQIDDLEKTIRHEMVHATMRSCMEDLLRDYPDASASMQGQANYRLGQAHFESGDHFHAIQPLRKAVDHLTGKRQQENCLVLLSNAYIKNNDRELAKSTLDKLESRFPESEHLKELGQRLSH